VHLLGAHHRVCGRRCCRRLRISFRGSEHGFLRCLLSVGYGTACDDCIGSVLVHSAHLLQILSSHLRGLEGTLSMLLCQSLGLTHFDGKTALMFFLLFHCVLDRSLGLLHPL
jgi:hypothetical protein